jgi:AmmeMemoRadiSam system protein A
MTELPPDAGPVLCEIARSAIATRVGAADPRFDAAADLSRPDPGGSEHLGYRNEDSWLDTLGATFVTLTQQGALRGCIGSLTAYRPLREDVAANAVNAALRDPRFPPLTADELPATHLEVSVLSAAEPYPFTDRADALSRLRPGVDGLILEYGSRRGTFLPQVWDSLSEPDEFLAHLVRKAGLPAGWWDDGARLSRYTVKAFEET